MNTLLPDPAPDFDQPIAVLKHCHDKIRTQLATLESLLQHLPLHGADQQAQQAAQAVLRYFASAAPNHHADEEDDLLPMLKATAEGEDAALLQALTPQILEEHQQMHSAWQHLETPLQHIAAGAAAGLPAAEVHAFNAAYAAHMTLEEGNIAPMAKRLFSVRQMAQLGNAMRARRGIALKE